ncbi:MAG: hypothetical protein AMJ81_13355 [Phycisphaerae bacterium SM23_33]|nr:MAG: hypothetical protein AMJ81_13355 [Phycisphaerae bacterium SM23_33]
MFEIHKYFLLDKYPLVLKFTRQPGDKDVIEIVDEIILNLFEAEKLSWQDFHVALDGGLNPVSFVAPDLATAWQCTGGQTRLDGVPDIATATHISWATDDPSQYVPYGSFADAPLNQLVLRGLVIDVSVLEAGESFFLKQWPTTPEPGALALLCLGALAWARKRPRS